MKIKELFKDNQDVVLENIKDVEFNKLTSISEAGYGDITWIRSGSKDIKTLLLSTNTTCLICDVLVYNEALLLKLDTFFIISPRPDLIFLSILKKVDTPQSKPNTNFKIGENTIIGENSIIGNAVIGDNCIISNNVRIYDNVVIGDNCIIREFCSIGGEGFGFVRDDGGLKHMPHIGKVIIEDNVHIFPFSNIDRSTLTSTIIRKGVKIDHHCHIGHNCEIGRDTMIAAKSVTSGGVKVGKNCFLGVNTVIKDKTTVGDFVTLGIGSVVVKDIPNNEIWAGNPAKFLKKNIK